MSASFSFESEDFDALLDMMRAFEGNALQAVNEVLHSQAGEMIYHGINPLINPSGRTFKGHTASATASDWPFYKTDEDLAVTVKTKSKFNYLYFPDDGTNTNRHAGMQDFMLRGAEAVSGEILELCMNALMNEWE